MFEPPDYLVDKDARVQAFWAEFCRATGVDVATPYQAWHFALDAELAHELADLVAHGPKRATAGLGWLTEKRPDLMPILGGYNVITELDGTPRVITRTTQIDIRPFREVDAAFAWDEGEGDRTLAFWREAHWDYFSSECASHGFTPSEDMPVVLERFEVLHPSTQH